MNENEELQSGFPDWLTEDYKVLEPFFCRSFLREHPMRCIRGRFYTVDGLVADESVLKKEIYDQISPWLETKIARKVDELLNALRMAAYSEPIALECDRIHVANGTLFTDGRFTPEKTYCNNRLTVSYRPDAPPPEKWLRFLAELLHPEDIPTLQEYLGYCLLPTTKGQKMLMLIGKGGEGKSRIGLVMRSIFGDSMNTTSIQKVENNRFSRADLESKLLMVDDDMDM
ncbi:MAG: DNA primase, partial [Oscillospiraceae bacterium]|nr:DNA primase [Oscillospiraceae bacterium]